jgi:hypothetical protein
MGIDNQLEDVELLADNLSLLPLQDDLRVRYSSYGTHPRILLRFVDTSTFGVGDLGRYRMLRSTLSGPPPQLGMVAGPWPAKQRQTVSAANASRLLPSASVCWTS